MPCDLPAEQRAVCLWSGEGGGRAAGHEEAAHGPHTDT